ncbi:MAG: hypothetical protein IID15_08845, partial [Candidatus Marinimicrobia bacterium]|nr:hypothetical protein [Candidatus Neomarinimicrobiota bacterium]
MKPPDRNSIHVEPMEEIMGVAWQQAGEYTDILYHKADGMAKIVINRPEGRNAFRPQKVTELEAAFAD